MLELRVYGQADALSAVAERLGSLPGVSHVLLSAAAPSTNARVTADVREDAGDAALEILDRLGVPPDDVALARLDVIGPGLAAAEPHGVVWADMLGLARSQARTRVRFLVLMAAAGVVAAFGVIEESAVLIVGAMAISPDLLPIMAACTGLVLRKWGLTARGLGALLVGFLAVIATAAAVTGFLNAVDLLPAGFALGEIPAGQTHVSVSTILIALTAGVAGMLAVETRASSAVGVAISVTTIPAAAFLGVALGIGELDRSLSALWVLGANVAMMVVGGSAALVVQRYAASRHALPDKQDP